MSALPLVARFKVLDAEGQEWCWAESPEHALGMIMQGADGDCRFRFEPWLWQEGAPVGQLDWLQYVAYCQEEGLEVLTYQRTRQPERA